MTDKKLNIWDNEIYDNEIYETIKLMRQWNIWDNEYMRQRNILDNEICETMKYMRQWNILDMNCEGIEKLINDNKWRYKLRYINVWREYEIEEEGKPWCNEQTGRRILYTWRHIETRTGRRL